MLLHISRRAIEVGRFKNNDSLVGMLVSEPEIQAIPGSVLKLFTWNVMRLTTGIAELRTISCEQDRNIVVLTETKMHKFNCYSSLIKPVLQGSSLLHSCKPAPNPLRVNLRVKRTLCTRKSNGLKTRKHTSTTTHHLGRDGTGGVTPAVKNC